MEISFKFPKKNKPLDTSLQHAVNNIQPVFAFRNCAQINRSLFQSVQLVNMAVDRNVSNKVVRILNNNKI